MTWEIEYYIEGDGSSPVEGFLDSIRPRPRAKLVQLIKRLEVDGPTLPFPYSSQIEGRLRELRTQLGKNRYRVLYYGDQERTFVLLHGVHKKTEELPEQDKQIALRRMKSDMEQKKQEGDK